MTAKSIDWDHLSRQGTIAPKNGPAFYPDDRRRKTFNRGKFVLRSLLYRPQLNRVFELFQTEPLRALPAHHPELLDKPIRPYRFACSTVNQRVRMVEDHYRLLLARYPDLIDPPLSGEGSNWPLSRGIIASCCATTAPFAGRRSRALSIVNEKGERLYSCAFPGGQRARAGAGDRGRCRGPSPVWQSPRAGAGPDQGGPRPEAQVAGGDAGAGIGRSHGANRVSAKVRMRAHIFQARRYSKKKKACLQADYDAPVAGVWRHRSGQQLRAACKPSSAQTAGGDRLKEEAMCRRRYEWLDLLVQGMVGQFARQ